MISRKFINRIIILAFFVLIGYCLATSIAVRSGIGIFLAVVSLGAGVVFLYLLAKQQQEAETEESY
jgi:positive regulator of sigma E activity